MRGPAVYGGVIVSTRRLPVDAGLLAYCARPGTPPGNASQRVAQRNCPLSLAAQPRPLYRPMARAPAMERVPRRLPAGPRSLGRALTRPAARADAVVAPDRAATASCTGGA